MSNNISPHSVSSESSVQLGEDVWVVHAFQKKSTRGIKTPKHGIDPIKARLKRLREICIEEELEVVKGIENVFGDLDHKNADADQVKAILF